MAGLFPDAIIADEKDAAWLGLNLFSDGNSVVMAAQATGLADSIRARGLRVFGVDLSELYGRGWREVLHPGASPMTTLTEAFIERESHVLAHNYHPLGVGGISGSRRFVYDVSGRPYLDLFVRVFVAELWSRPSHPASSSEKATGSARSTSRAITTTG